MKKLLLLVAITMTLSCLPASAQLGWDAFGGFSTLTSQTRTFTQGQGGALIPTTDRAQSFGWQASFSLNWTPVLGFVGDFGGQYKGIDTGIPGVDLTANSYQFLFGPRASARGESYTGFVHALMGGFRRGFTTSTSAGSASSGSNTLAFGLGGGVDWHWGPDFAIRIVQVDWIPNRLDGDWKGSDFRFGIGFVLRAEQ